MYEIIYQAIPEAGQKQIKFEKEKKADLDTLKKKLSID